MKIIHKYNLVPYFDFICFQYKKNQYLDILHKQKKKLKEMHIRMHNNDFDILLRCLKYSANYKSQKYTKMPKK